LLASKAYRSYDIVGACAESNERGSTVNPSIPNLSGCIVARVPQAHEPSTKLLAERGNGTRANRSRQFKPFCTRCGRVEAWQNLPLTLDGERATTLSCDVKSADR
jgi:hypothetical protein